jgi:hypothetical protein
VFRFPKARLQGGEVEFQAKSYRDNAVRRRTQDMDRFTEYCQVHMRNLPLFCKEKFRASRRRMRTFSKKSRDSTLDLLADHLFCLSSKTSRHLGKKLRDMCNMVGSHSESLRNEISTNWRKKLEVVYSINVDEFKEGLREYWNRGKKFDKIVVCWGDVTRGNPKGHQSVPWKAFARAFAKKGVVLIYDEWGTSVACPGCGSRMVEVGEEGSRTMSCTNFLATNEPTCSFFTESGIHSIDRDICATISQIPICSNHFTHDLRPVNYRRDRRRIPEAVSYCKCMRNGDVDQIIGCAKNRCDGGHCSALCQAMHRSHYGALVSALNREQINNARVATATAATATAATATTATAATATAATATDTTATDTATPLSPWQIGQMVGVRRARTQFFDRAARATALATRFESQRTASSEGN